MNDDTERREGGAWIGQHPDENTEELRENLDPEAERVAVRANEAEDPGGPDTGWPQGHRQGDHVTDDDVRRAGEDR